MLRDVINPQIEATIQASGVIDDYTYETVFMLVGTPQGPQPMIGILLGVPDPANIGQKTTTMGTIPGPFPTESMVEQATLALIKGLSEQRSQGLLVP